LSAILDAEAILYYRAEISKAENIFRINAQRFAFKKSLELVG
jgi:hypothetical protein